MDQNLFDRWQRAEPPFDDRVLTRQGFLSVGDLRGTLQVAVAKLREEYGSAPLIAFDDWHEHDGVVLPSRQSTWKELSERLSSDSAVYEPDGDDFVHRAFYPPGCEFLLRYDASENYGNSRGDIGGTFDLAASIELLNAILAECRESLRPKLRVENAKQYFDSKFRG